MGRRPALIGALEHAKEGRRAKQGDGASASKNAGRDLERDERGAVVRHDGAKVES